MSGFWQSPKVGALHFLDKTKEPECLDFKGFQAPKEQGMRESNSHQRFWRPLSYHLTNPLYTRKSGCWPQILLHCTLKTTYMLVDGQSFFESILTCVPILQRWSLRNYVAQCHLLRKCSGIIRNASPQASLFRSIPAVSCPLPRLFGQALTRLVTVSSMCYHTSTPALSTSSSSRGFTS